MNNMDFLDITRKLSIYGWKIEGTMATSVFAKNESDNTLYRYVLDLIFMNATYEVWKDGKRISQDSMDYKMVLDKALKNMV